MSNEVDKVLAEAVELARNALSPIADDSEIGEHQGVESEGVRLATHSFACLKEGYRGWRWVATLARVPRGRTPTVCEIDLLPGANALLAPRWIPWAERVTPEELKHNVEQSMIPDELRDRPRTGPSANRPITNGVEAYYLANSLRQAAGFEEPMPLPYGFICGKGIGQPIAEDNDMPDRMKKDSRKKTKKKSPKKKKKGAKKSARNRKKKKQ